MFMTKLKKLNLEQKFQDNSNVSAITLKTVDKLVDKLFILSIRLNYWQNPRTTYDRKENRVALHWRNKERKYIVYVEEDDIQYVAIVESEIVRGNSLHLNHHQELKEFWKWISYYVGD